MGHDPKKPRGRRGIGSIYHRESDGRWCGEMSRVTGDGVRGKRVVNAKTRAEIIQRLNPDRRRAGASLVFRAPAAITPPRPGAATPPGRPALDLDSGMRTMRWSTEEPPWTTR
jgi:hypothetical protein